MGDKILQTLIITTTIVFGVNVALSSLSASTGSGIFKQTTGNVSKNHPSLITPIGWTFAIWSLIYLWLTAVVVYLLINLFRPNVNGIGKMYCNPQIFSKEVALAMIINQIFSITWLFVWNESKMAGAAVVLILIAITNWITLICLSRNLFRATTYLQANSRVDLWVYRIIVQNGIAIHTAWTSLACLLNSTLGAIYDIGVQDYHASLTCLSILLILILAWTYLDIFAWDNYFRYMFMPILTLAWGLNGIRARLNTTPPDDAILIKHFVTALLCITIICAFGKISVMILRHFRKPFLSPSSL